MKILITAGASREPIDSVRFLSNISTGATGAALADVLASLGHSVTFLHGIGSALPQHPLPSETFSSAEDLRGRLLRRLAEEPYNAVIMAAAIADYRAAMPLEGKFPSNPETLTLSLVRNPKILAHLKSLSPTPLCVVGFKLTAGADEDDRLRAVHEQFGTGAVDIVVHNDLDEIRHEPVHPFWVYASRHAKPERRDGTTALGETLHRLLTAQPCAS